MIELGGFGERPKKQLISGFLSGLSGGHQFISRPHPCPPYPEGLGASWQGGVSLAALRQGSDPQA
jgi:hypothetical protein